MTLHSQFIHILQTQCVILAIQGGLKPKQAAEIMADAFAVKEETLDWAIAEYSFDVADLASQFVEWSLKHNSKPAWLDALSGMRA